MTIGYFSTIFLIFSDFFKKKFQHFSNFFHNFFNIFKVLKNLLNIVNLTFFTIQSFFTTIFTRAQDLHLSLV